MILQKNTNILNTISTFLWARQKLYLENSSILSNKEATSSLSWPFVTAPSINLSRRDKSASRFFFSFVILRAFYPIVLQLTFWLQLSIHVHPQHNLLGCPTLLPALYSPSQRFSEYALRCLYIFTHTGYLGISIKTFTDIAGL